MAWLCDAAAVQSTCSVSVPSPLEAWAAGEDVRAVQGPRLVIECVFCGSEKELSTSCSGCGSRRTDVRLAEVVV
jgi:hypothetical protein